MKTKVSLIILVFGILAVAAFATIKTNIFQKQENEKTVTAAALMTQARILPETNSEMVELVNKEQEKQIKLEKERKEKEDMINQINKSLTSTLTGKGELFVNYSLEKGVDPYLAVSIVLLETGCTWGCSTLVTQCNNVGGMHGTPSCGSGPYGRFSTLEIGIKKFIDNLADNYIKQGLRTPEQINKKYATSSTWATKVNNYMVKIKNK